MYLLQKNKKIEVDEIQVLKDDIVMIIRDGKKGFYIEMHNQNVGRNYGVEKDL